ncbi:type II toxin-antitoxin system HicB family antitoxin [Luteococcus sanguinis]|uniref:Type II toxin-antitoxin system HicB family antitoxin n=1 Tax=Luteococcus sanguinis TaxID=174038 RepID=A0ABW1X417_9ACTN
MSTTTVDSARYTYRVTWSPEDDEFVATCVEFPSLSWLAASPEDALSGLRAVVDAVVADMHAEGEVVPEPLSVRHYSGKFQLRLGEDLHRRLAIEAAEQHVSLNQYVTRKLAEAS